MHGEGRITPAKDTTNQACSIYGAIANRNCTPPSLFGGITYARLYHGGHATLLHNDKSAYRKALKLSILLTFHELTTTTLLQLCSHLGPDLHDLQLVSVLDHRWAMCRTAFHKSLLCAISLPARLFLIGEAKSEYTKNLLWASFVERSSFGSFIFIPPVSELCTTT